MTSSVQASPAISDTVLRRLVAFVAASRGRPLNEAQTQAMTLRLTDAMACALLATGSADFAALRARFSDDAGPCTIIGSGRASLEHAAFLNVFLVRQHDWNDTYIGKNGGHPSDLIGGALAVGEYAGKSGADVLHAIAIGTHVMLDLCDAASALARGWDPSTYLGIASCVSAGVLLDLTNMEMAHAVSMTTVSGNMLMGRVGKVSSWKGLSSAAAVRNSIFYAQLAKSGMSGPDPVFEGDFGFIKHISGDMSLELDAARDRTADTHLKFYPAVYHGQGPIESCLRLHGEIAAALRAPSIGAAIESVEIDIYDFALRYTADTPDKWAPENVETADHSLPFLAAHCLVTGEFGPGSIERTLHDADVLALTRKVKVRSDAAFSAQWPELTPSRVTVTAAGRVFHAQVDAITGHPLRPLTQDDVFAKFMSCATPLVGEADARVWAQTLADFAHLSQISQVLRAPFG
jgi:2-methylcitrate dehydratase